MSVKAAILEQPNGAFVIKQVALTGIGAHEVLVKVAGVGICHTDLAVRDRVIPVPLPVVLGHEAAGVVEATGDAVQDVTVGDHVVLSYLSCGNCPACDDAVPGYCDQFGALNFLGKRLDGSTAYQCDGAPIGSHFFGQSSFASHAVAHERNVVKVDKSLPLELLGPLGCGFMTGAGAVLNSLDCAPGSSIAVFGAGPVGMAAIMAAKARNCEVIIAIDPLESRRAIALEMGATAAIDPSAVDDPAIAVRIIVPRGVDSALDTTGIPDVISAAIGCLAKRGTCALVAAPKVAGSAVAVQFGSFTTNGTRLVGVMEGDCDPKTFIPELLDMYLRGQFPFDRLIQTYPFADIEHAIDQQAKGACVKAVLIMAPSHD